MNVSSSVAVTALVVGASLLSAPAAAAPPPALACGDRVEGTVVLTRDLVCATGPGLVLTHGATLDLGGHTLRGSGSGTALLLTAPDAWPPEPVTVENGVVRDWELGLETYDSAATVRAVTFDRIERDAVSGLASALTVDAVTVRRSGAGVDFSYNGTGTVTRSRFVDTGLAVYLGQYSQVEVSDTTIERTTIGVACSEGFVLVTRSRLVQNTTAVLFDWCTNSRLHDSELARNGTALATRTPAPYVTGEWEGAQVFRNRFDRNEVAVDLRENAHLQDNRFTRNGTAFRALTAGNDFPISLFALERNTFDRNGDAVDVDTRIRMQDNVATRNTGWGIHTPAAEDLGGNVAWGNGREPQCTGVVCTGRPRS
ncbi:NosD domain-containing protein [Cellulomonas sp. 179-A 9B4 NHS]|uniref:right-handed parallel beta-helix repeat-containing protein n=1 Tax=Cellulomonas sp. 179-A 9B4 NHS TaxID=3142379 RepID=UPI0039A1F805